MLFIKNIPGQHVNPVLQNRESDHVSGLSPPSPICKCLKVLINLKKAEVPILPAISWG